MARARHGGYIFQRSGSNNFWIKLRSRAGRVEKSLGTSDRREAEILALPLIAEHKAALLAARPRLEMTPYKLEARATWALFKSLCGKPLKEADYDDGRRLVKHFETKGLKRAKIEKKIGWLRAAVRQNMKTKNGLKFNPFSNVISERKPGDS